MSKVDPKAARAELARRQRLPNAVKAFAATMSDPQKKLIESSAMRKVTHAGRRGGKTTALIAMALQAAVDTPKSIVPIVQKHLTTQAAETFWRELQAIDEKYGLKSYFQHTVRHAHLSNGSEIHMMGADTMEAADKVRGGKFRRVIVDEAGTYRDSILKYLIESCAEPAVFDYGGDIVLAGTPGLRAEGFFYDTVHTFKGWEQHSWTLLENEALPLDRALSPEAKRVWRDTELQSVLDSKGWTWETPRFVREYLGQWCVDTAGGMFRLESYNVGQLLTLQRPTYVLSVDVGFEDPCAFVVLAICPGDPHIYVVESKQLGHLIPSACAIEIEKYMARYPGIAVVMDSGGAGKGYAEEARQTYGVPVIPARKQDKYTQIDAMNGDFKSGTVHIMKEANKDLIQDLRALPWNEKRTDAESGFDNHLPDALRYGLTHIRVWRDTQGMGNADEPIKGSAEWWARYEQLMWNQQRDADAAAEHAASLDFDDPDALTSLDYD
jgi:hypothetical protein